MKTTRTRTRKPSSKRTRKAATGRLVKRIATEHLAALEKAVDFSPIMGFPESFVRLVVPAAEPLLGKHPSRWRSGDVARLQQSIDSLPVRMLAAALSDPSII